MDAAGGELGHAWPVFSAGGDTLIFTVGNAHGDLAVSTLTLATGARRTMRTDGGAFALTDRSELLFLRGQRAMRALYANGRLSAADRLETTAAIRSGGGSGNDTGAIALSTSGTLASVPSPDIKRRSLVWIAPDGRQSEAGFGAREFRSVSLSPDGRRAALGVGLDQESVLYRADAAGGPLTPLAKPGPGVTSWSPDGGWIAAVVRLLDARMSTVVRVAAEAGGNWEPLVSSENVENYALCVDDPLLVLRRVIDSKPLDVAPDGRILAIREDDSVRPDHLVVEQNWLRDVRARTP